VEHSASDSESEAGEDPDRRADHGRSVVLTIETVDNVDRYDIIIKPLGRSLFTTTVWYGGRVLDGMELEAIPFLSRFVADLEADYRRRHMP
jgi:hypothetical protein